jgi:hypothetical protein
MSDTAKLLAEARKIIDCHLRATHKDFLVRSADHLRQLKKAKP